MANLPLSLDDELLQKAREAALRDHTSGMLGGLEGVRAAEADFLQNAR